MSRYIHVPIYFMRTIKYNLLHSSRNNTIQELTAISFNLYISSMTDKYFPMGCYIEVFFGGLLTDKGITGQNHIKWQKLTFLLSSSS